MRERGLAIVALVLMLAFGTAGAQRNLTYDVEAAFLYNFLTFIDWPDSAFADRSAPFRICVLGADPVGDALATTIRGATVGTHPIVFEGQRDERTVTSCHVLFIPRTEEAQAPGVMRAAARLPMLVLGESRRVLELCGGIAFALENDRVRFDVNLASLSSRGLKASSKLLRVAREASEKVGRCE